MRTALDLDIPLWTSAPAKELIVEGGRAAGAVIEREGRPVRVLARRGIVLASGGFPHDRKRTATFYPHVAAGRTHVPMAPLGNTGEGARLAESVGGGVETNVVQPAAFMPVSLIPGRSGTDANWPHIVDRQKPGFIAVTSEGKRFANESQPYSDFVPALVRACENLPDTFCWLIADHRAVRRYGMGFMKPAPVPTTLQIRSGYVIRGETIEELAGKLGIDPGTLRATVERFNTHARLGADPDFNRGVSIYDHSQGDPEHKPNPNLAPLESGPFYALKMLPGDIGTFAGIRTDARARVIDGEGRPVPGLYAAGNDCLSAMSGGYPGAGGTLGPGMTFAYIAAKDIINGDVAAAQAA